MWYFEYNYQALSSMLQETALTQNGQVGIDLGLYHVVLCLLEETRYTQLVEIRIKFTNSEQIMPDAVFEIRIYSDAKVAEVTSYQGSKRLQPRYAYPNPLMYVPDEKYQNNLLLYDWLCTCSRLNYKNKITENCQN